MDFRNLVYVDRRTNRETTKNFIENVVIRFTPDALQDTVLVLDNHSANHSRLVTEYCRERGLELKFLPPYSSTLNPGKYILNGNDHLLVEHVWSVLKNHWGR